MKTAGLLPWRVTDPLHTVEISLKYETLWG